MGLGIWIIKFRFLIIVILANMPVASKAMDMKYDPGIYDYDKLYVDGTVELDDPEKLRTILKEHPQIDLIKIGQSPGGSLFGGLEVAKIIYQSGLRVDIEGPAASAATVISLGARNRLRYFEGINSSALSTELLFHCAYKSGENVCDQDATRAMSVSLEALTGRNSDEWFRELIVIPPSEVKEIPLERIMGYGNWTCEGDGYAYVDCIRGHELIEKRISRSNKESLMRRVADLTFTLGEEEVWEDDVLGSIKVRGDIGAVGGKQYNVSYLPIRHEETRITLGEFSLTRSIDYGSCTMVVNGSYNNNKFYEEMAFSFKGIKAEWDPNGSRIIIRNAKLLWPQVETPAEIDSIARLFISEDGTIGLPNNGLRPINEVANINELSQLCVALDWE